MQLYQKIFQLMMEERKDLFGDFKIIHDKYILDPVVNKAEFNRIGSDVLDVIRVYERKVCGRTESGGYGKFSANLSQKFWDQVRKVFPKIDFVGIK